MRGDAEDIDAAMESIREAGWIEVRREEEEIPAPPWKVTRVEVIPE
jgi:predicted RNase H-like HicB family nuclease